MTIALKKINLPRPCLGEHGEDCEDGEDEEDDALALRRSTLTVRIGGRVRICGGEGMNNLIMIVPNFHESSYAVDFKHKLILFLPERLKEISRDVPESSG